VIEIDGSQGEGGGQILRTSLALSALTGTPVRLYAIRAGRAKPGLMRQHLTCVEAAAAVCGAEVRGAALGSRELELIPGPIRGGAHRFTIGTAGSTGLVLQTVLPPLLAAPEPAHVTIEGGTHNPLSPPFDFLASAFVPVLVRMGAHVRVRLERPGFHPAGGGRVVCDLEPGALHPIELIEAGPIQRRHARALLSRLPAHVGRRELDVVQERLGWSPDECEIVEVESAGLGNALVLEVVRDGIAEVVTGFGEKGTRAELVAERACREMAAYLDAGVPVAEHLADQLLIPMALAGGGRFRTVPPTLHTTTNIDVIRRFLDVSIDVADAGGATEITVTKP